MAAEATHILPPTCTFYVPDDAPRQLTLRGRCSINGGVDHQCIITEVCTDRMVVKCGHVAGLADRVIVDLPRIGLIRGIVKTVSFDGFVVHFGADVSSKLGRFFAGLDRGLPATQFETRGFERIAPNKKVVKLTRSKQPACLVGIINLSRSGVAFTTDESLTEGERVLLGAYAGRVVRLLKGGAVVQFDSPLDQEHFDEMIDPQDSGA